MLIKIGYDIALRLTAPTAVVYLLHVHPSRSPDLLQPEQFQIEPALDKEVYIDSFGNLCGRVNAPEGILRFTNRAVIRDSGAPDLAAPNARQHDIREVPVEILNFVVGSRYCEVDSELLDIAWKRFAGTQLGWPRVAAICDFVHTHLKFDYQRARANRTALDAYRERVGVCRDFTHLAITFCRCMNIPARYVTGYLGDIRVPPVDDPMDFSAWFEVYLGGQWYTFDARHNCRRIGRIPIGRGRDAGDVPITLVFGQHQLDTFKVVTEELTASEGP